MVKNDVRLDRAIGGQTRDLNWREQMKKNLENIATRMMNDYKKRRDIYECSPEKIQRARTETEKTLDWYDASVSNFLRNLFVFIFWNRKIFWKRDEKSTQAYLTTN